MLVEPGARRERVRLVVAARELARRAAPDVR
jgi:hypothetical protein